MPAVDKDLSDSLLRAKKKPQYFAIVSKGPKVLHLIVQKKPIKDNDAKNAKQEFGGNAITRGVVQPGDGPELVFQVLEKPAVSEVKLRQYITDTAGLRLKTTFALLPALGEVDENAEDELPDDLESEQPPSSPVPMSATTAPVPTASPPPTTGTVPAPPSPEALKFAQRLKNLKPNLDKVAAAGVPSSPGATRGLVAASEAFKQKDFAAGQRVLDQLEPVIKMGLQEIAERDAAENKPLLDFNERLKGLVGKIKAAAGTPAGEEAKLQASEAGAAASQNDFVRGNALLDQVEKLLGGQGHAAATTGGQAQPEATTATSAVDELARRLEQLQPRVDKVTKWGGSRGRQLNQFVAMAKAQIAADDGKRAVLMINRIERLLDEAEEADARFRAQFVELRRVWKSARDAVGQQLAALQQNLAQRDDAELKQIAANGLDWILGDLDAPLGNALGALEKATPETRARAADAALETLGAYLDHLDASQEIKVCDESDFGVPVSIRSTLGSALEQLGRLVVEV